MSDEANELREARRALMRAEPISAEELDGLALHVARGYLPDVPRKWMVRLAAELLEARGTKRSPAWRRKYRGE